MLAPIKAAVERQLVPDTLTSIRTAIFYREFNGCHRAGAVVQVGRRWQIDPEKWDSWKRTGPPISPPGLRDRYRQRERAAAAGAP